MSKRACLCLILFFISLNTYSVTLDSPTMTSGQADQAFTEIIAGTQALDLNRHPNFDWGSVDWELATHLLAVRISLTERMIPVINDLLRTRGVALETCVVICKERVAWGAVEWSWLTNLRALSIENNCPEFESVNQIFSAVVAASRTTLKQVWLSHKAYENWNEIVWPEEVRLTELNLVVRRMSLEKMNCILQAAGERGVKRLKIVNTGQTETLNGMQARWDYAPELEELFISNFEIDVPSGMVSVTITEGLERTDGSDEDVIV